jgi:hypothetical protein
MTSHYRYVEYQQAAAAVERGVRFASLYPEPERDASGRPTRMRRVTSGVSARDVGANGGIVSLARELAIYFEAWLASRQVMQVMGQGPVPGCDPVFPKPVSDGTADSPGPCIF